jgi:DNA-binding transcriptional regulator YdaS (Cro superfamily)
MKDKPEEKSAPSVVLHEFFQSRIGRQKAIADASGLFASTLSSMAHGKHPISLEAALLIEIAADGAVRAETLCPARAEVIDKFLQLRCPAYASA